MHNLCKCSQGVLCVVPWQVAAAVRNAPTAATIASQLQQAQQAAQLVVLATTTGASGITSAQQLLQQVAPQLSAGQAHQLLTKVAANALSAKVRHLPYQVHAGGAVLTSSCCPACMHPKSKLAHAMQHQLTRTAGLSGCCWLCCTGDAGAAGSGQQRQQQWQ
jgi:hypothetical protein